MDFRFHQHDLVRIIDSDSLYFDHAGMVESCQICQSRQVPMYRMFGSIWFVEHQLEREVMSADEPQRQAA